MDREFSRAIRYHRPLSTVFVDLNQFKKINDTHGHEVGDAVLAHMASTLMAEKRQTDIVARFAGDEFVAILADTPSEKAEAFIRRVEARYSRPHKIGGISLSVRFSYGIASTQEGLYASASDLVKAADGELYKVKQRLTRRQSVPV